MTMIEQRAADSLANNLPRILKELKRANKLEEFRLRKEYASAENTPIIDKIMED